MTTTKTERGISREDIYAYVENILGETEHTKRVESMANAVAGIVHGAALAIHTIGAALAQLNGRAAKHAIKQVDRLLSNAGFDVMERSREWIAHVIGEHHDVVVALDWTDYAHDGQATVCLALVTGCGRAQPLLWRTVAISELKGNRNRFEDELLVRFQERLPPGVRVTVTADRGFADQALFRFLETLGFDYVIRIRRNTRVRSDTGERREACQWLHSDGRSRLVRSVYVTHDDTPVPMFVAVKKPRMDAAWFLVSSRSDWTASQLITVYGRRFTIEEMFRDEKDARYGLGLSHTRISQGPRRDRLLFLAAIARDLLTVLGAAGESLGFDRHLKANTVAKRTHSLYRQGCFYYGTLPTLPEARLTALMKRFADFLLNSSFYRSTWTLV